VNVHNSEQERVYGRLFVNFCSPVFLFFSLYTTMHANDLRPPSIIAHLDPTANSAFGWWRILLSRDLIVDPLSFASFGVDGRPEATFLPAGDAYKYTNDDPAMTAYRAFQLVLMIAPKIQGHAMWGLPKGICCLLLDRAFEATNLGRIMAWAKQAYTRLRNKEKWYRTGLRRAVLLHPKIWACVQKIAGDDPGLNTLHSISHCWWCHRKGRRVVFCNPLPSRLFPMHCSTMLCSDCFMSLFDLVAGESLSGFPSGWTLPEALFTKCDLEGLSPHRHRIGEGPSVSMYNCKFAYPRDRVDELRRQKEQLVRDQMARAFPSYCQPWSEHELEFPTMPPQPGGPWSPLAPLSVSEWGTHSLRQQMYSHHWMMYQIGRIDRRRRCWPEMDAYDRVDTDKVAAALQEAVDTRAKWLEMNPRPPTIDAPQVAASPRVTAFPALICVVLCATALILRRIW